MNKKAIILVSGGLDSATCLMLAKSQGFDCYALSFDYNQRHRSELNAAANVAAFSDISEHKIITVPTSLFLNSALTDETIDVPDYSGSGDIPVTYVPARNLIFFSLATAWAESIGANDIFIGCSSVDYSGYPDCRPEFISAFEIAANLATKCGIEGQHLSIHAPLSSLSKAQTIELGLSIGADYSLTVSCYRADEKGRACGECDSCYLRKKGFADTGIPDPTNYVAKQKEIL